MQPESIVEKMTPQTVMILKMCIGTMARVQKALVRYLFVDEQSRFNRNARRATLVSTNTNAAKMRKAITSGCDVWTWIQGHPSDQWASEERMGKDGRTTMTAADPHACSVPPLRIWNSQYVVRRLSRSGRRATHQEMGMSNAIAPARMSNPPR